MGSTKRRAVHFPSGTKLYVEVADTPAARKAGLMFRNRLSPRGGMLFIFKQAGPYLFWMKNCKFPIDIIWLNERKEIIHVSERTPLRQTHPFPIYGPLDQNALYVLEVTSGFTEKEKLTIGMKVKF